MVWSAGGTAVTFWYDFYLARSYVVQPRGRWRYAISKIEYTSDDCGVSEELTSLCNLMTDPSSPDERMAGQSRFTILLALNPRHER